AARLLELGRLVEETDTAFDGGARKVVDDVVATGDARAEIEVLGVARVVEAHAGNDLGAITGRHLGLQVARGPPSVVAVGERQRGTRRERSGIGLARARRRRKANGDVIGRESQIGSSVERYAGERAIRELRPIEQNVVANLEKERAEPEVDAVRSVGKDRGELELVAEVVLVARFDAVKARSEG